MISGFGMDCSSSFVTYSNKAKRKLVGVKKETLETMLRDYKALLDNLEALTPSHISSNAIYDRIANL